MMMSTKHENGTVKFTLFFFNINILMAKMSAKHLSPEALNQRRMEAVRLRLDGLTVAETAAQTALSAPTISGAWKAFREGGWAAVPVRPRGRHKGDAHRLGGRETDLLWQRLHEWPANRHPGWTSRDLAEVLSDATGPTLSPRALEHWLSAQNLKPRPLTLTPQAQRSREGRWLRQRVQPALERTRAQGGSTWLGGVRVITSTADGHARRYQLYVHGKRNALYTRCFLEPPRADDYLALFERLAEPGPAALIFHGADFRASTDIGHWLERHPDFTLLDVPPNSNLAAGPEHD